MEYTYRYINRHIEGGTVYYTLIIEARDASGINHVTRIDKSFTMDVKLIDNELLHLEATREIDIIATTPAPAEDVTGDTSGDPSQ